MKGGRHLVTDGPTEPRSYVRMEPASRFESVLSGVVVLGKECHADGACDSGDGGGARDKSLLADMVCGGLGGGGRHGL